MKTKIGDIVVTCNGKEIGTARSVELRQVPNSEETQYSMLSKENIMVVDYTIDLIDLVPLNEKDTTLAQSLVVQMLQEMDTNAVDDFTKGRVDFANEMYLKLQKHLNFLQRRGALKEEENNG